MLVTVFVLFGLTGVVWAMGWFYWFRNDPSEHRAVNAAELEKIVEKMESGEQSLEESLKSFQRGIELTRANAYLPEDWDLHVSIGIGYTLPFQTIAAPWINSGEQFATAMRGVGLEGVRGRHQSARASTVWRNAVASPISGIRSLKTMPSFGKSGTSRIFAARSRSSSRRRRRSTRTCRPCPATSRPVCWKSRR